MAIGTREINEFRRRKFGKDEAQFVAFVCECTNPGCLRAVLLTPPRYDELRASPEPSVLYAAHRPPTAEAPA